MIAAVIERHGAVPVVGGRDAPVPSPGSTLVRVDAAGLNPVDVAVASGRFYAPVPDPPYVPGAEVVGRVESSESVLSGTRVWGLPLTGGLAELASVPDDRLVRVPEGLGDHGAIVAGIAGLAGWMSVRSRGGIDDGEAVAVLGASGVVGLVAVQAARAAGAGIVVAVARSAAGRERAVQAGADVALEPGDDLADRLRAAADGGLDVVIDGLWGAPAAAAVAAMAPGGRLVQVGNSAEPLAELPGGPFRGGRLDLRGFSVFSESAESRRAGYSELAAAIMAGVVTIPTEESPIGGVGAAWERLVGGAGGVKLLVRPG